MINTFVLENGGTDGAFYNPGWGGQQIQSDGTGSYRNSALNFYANLSNSIYRNSSTVQPPALRVLVAIRYWPNITGIARITHESTTASRNGYWFGTGAFYPSNDFTQGIYVNNGDWKNPGGNDTLNLNASRSSSIYGNSATVQPSSARALIAIRY